MSQTKINPKKNQKALKAELDERMSEIDKQLGIIKRFLDLKEIDNAYVKCARLNVAVRELDILLFNNIQ